MNLAKYPLYLLKSRLNEEKRYIGAMLPLSLFEELERFAYEHKLSLSDIIRLAVWDFLRREGKGDIREELDLRRN